MQFVYLSHKHDIDSYMCPKGLGKYYRVKTTDVFTYYDQTHMLLLVETDFFISWVLRNESRQMCIYHDVMNEMTKIGFFVKEEHTHTDG